MKGVRELSHIPQCCQWHNSKVEEQGVEVDTDADRSSKLGHSAPQLGVVRVPDKKGGTI